MRRQGTQECMARAAARGGAGGEEGGGEESVREEVGGCLGEVLL